MHAGARAALPRAVGDVEGFLAEHWTRGPHLHAGAGQGGFGDLLSLDDVDRIVTSTGLRAPGLRLVRGGKPVAPAAYTRTATIGSRTVADLVDTGRVLELHHRGATIVLQGLQRSWEPLRTFCGDLERELTHRVQANAYLTPPGAQGLRVHHDTHDVFALQTHGRKHWVVYAPHLDAPLPGQGWSGEAARTAPVLDLTLQPGDALYVPRGAPHAAATVEEPSLHITVGVVATTWHDLLKTLLARAADEPAFRAALPAGWADDPQAAVPQAKGVLQRLASFVAEQDPGEILDRAAERFRHGRRPPLRGQLHQLGALAGLDDATRVAPRPQAQARVTLADGRAALGLGDRSVGLPGWVEPALQRLLAGRVRVGDLADLVGDAASRRVLVRRLVREGALVVVDA